MLVSSWQAQMSSIKIAKIAPDLPFGYITLGLSQIHNSVCIKFHDFIVVISLWSGYSQDINFIVIVRWKHVYPNWFYLSYTNKEVKQKPEDFLNANKSLLEPDLCQLQGAISFTYPSRRLGSIGFHSLMWHGINIVILETLFGGLVR